MAHEFESGFFVREPAWHGLGTVIDTAPTSKDALMYAGLDWSVNQDDVMVNGVVVPGYKANIRSTDKSVLGIVSDRYKIVQNVEAFDFTDELLGSGVKYETAGSLRNGKTIWLLAKMETANILGDAIEPYLCFTNAHDGSGAVRVCCTPIRIVCANTLSLALRNAPRTWSTRHIGDINAKKHEAARTLGLAKDYMSELANEANNLATQKISIEDVGKMLDELFGTDKADTERKKQNIAEAKETFYMCYTMPDLNNFFGTKYGVINAMADMVDHRSPARNTKNYAENNFYRVINGHALLDQTYEMLKAHV